MSAFETACNKTWFDALKECKDDVGFDPPGGPNATNADEIIKVCASDPCQAFASVVRDSNKSNCSIATIYYFPNGIWTATFCASTPAPVTTSRGPTTPTATTTPVPTTTTPPPSATASRLTTTAPTVMPTTPSPTPQPPPTNGSNLATIVGVSAVGVLLVVVIIVAVILLRRRRSRSSLEHAGSTNTGKDTTSFTSASTPRTEPSTTNDMWGGIAINMMRLPYDKIQFGDVVSQGGFGEVCHGFYNGQPVAIKRLLAPRRKDNEKVDSFFAEIQLTSTLDHSCIVRFIGVAWDAPSNLCMITEFMAGGDLRGLLSEYAKRGAPNGFDYDKLHIAVQVAHALTYLHSLQPVVVHRDLKSRNILLTEDHDAKLIDFGVSTERRDLTMTAGVGTSLWMAPEVMMGERYDEKADIFSFGVVLSELDTHELPYSNARDTSHSSGGIMADILVMQNVALGKLLPQFSKDTDPEILALANDCLKVDPKLRPTAADVLYRLHKARNRGSLV